MIHETNFWAMFQSNHITAVCSDWMVMIFCLLMTKVLKVQKIWCPISGMHQTTNDKWEERTFHQWFSYQFRLIWRQNVDEECHHMWHVVFISECEQSCMLCHVLPLSFNSTVFLENRQTRNSLKSPFSLLQSRTSSTWTISLRVKIALMEMMTKSTCSLVRLLWNMTSTISCLCLE